MNLTRCERGHFYDMDKYQQCPHCNAAVSGNMNSTVAFNPSMGETMPGAVPSSGLGTMTAPAPSLGASALADNEKTISFFNSKKGFQGIDPVVGWLICTKGSHRGKEFRLVAGQNFIGRDAKLNTVALSGENSVSREKHAVVVYEPRQNMFLALPGDSKELSYINGSVVLAQTEFKKNDRLLLGEVELMLIPCCDEAFRWENPGNAQDEPKQKI